MRTGGCHYAIIKVEEWARVVGLGKENRCMAMHACLFVVVGVEDVKLKK